MKKYCIACKTTHPLEDFPDKRNVCTARRKQQMKDNRDRKKHQDSELDWGDGASFIRGVERLAKSIKPPPAKVFRPGDKGFQVRANLCTPISECREVGTMTMPNQSSTKTWSGDFSGVRA